MALKQHIDLNEMFRQQVENSKSYVLPFVEKTLNIDRNTKILEIGCAEGGVLLSFMEKGAYCVGVDLEASRIDSAKHFFEQEIAEGKIKFMYKNVFDKDFRADYRNYFDLIILKDVIEHIPDQESFIPFMKELLNDKGQIFFGFPPWQMPFGGHQQVCRSKVLSFLPYYHLLPTALYKKILQWGGETEGVIKELIFTKETGISIERFESIVKRSAYKIVNRQWFLINPIYEFKFNLKPRKQNLLFGAIPYLRNYLTTCAYYTIQK